MFLRRTASAIACPGCWDFPGGGLEGDESAEQCAVREAREEVGFVPEGARSFHTRTISGSAPVKGVAGPGGPPVANVPVDGGSPVTEPAPPLVPEPNQVPPDVDFTTFLQRVTNEFTPELNDEHDGWAWAPVGAPPQPLHPGCRIALDRLAMDEVGVARAMADGRLTSPQRYENVTLWAIRLTGTGASYRPKHDEFVFREGADHLTPDALARWNGAPVIFQHPKGSLLDSEEFGKRVVGTVFLPYVAGDEAWGIAKIWDDDTNRLLSEEDLSTSPGVNFQDHKVNRVLRLEDGSKVLKEGKPSLVDHVAICQLGVWDKGGEPSGIRSEAREDSAMTAEEEKAKADADAKEAEEKAKADAAKKDAEEAEKKREEEEKAKADKAKADADAGKDLDTKLSHIADAVSGIADRLDAMGKRMDAFEEKDRKDAADKAKKDAAKADDAETVHKRIADVERIVREQGAKLEAVPDDEHARIADAWARADDVISAFGQTTPRPMPGETSIMYRRRVAKLLQPHSPTWAKIDLGSKAFADDAAFAIVEGQIMAEAGATARNPATVQAGTLRMVERRRDGHTVREFHGEPRAWMDEMAGATGLRATGSFNTGGLGRTN